MSVVELEFMNFQTPSQDGYSNGSQTRDIAAFLERNAPSALRPMTAGSFSYSATRPVAFKKYFWDIFNTSARFNCDIEGWHTEGGPGVYEAVSELHFYDRNVANQPRPSKCVMLPKWQTGCPCLSKSSSRPFVAQTLIC